MTHGIITRKNIRKKIKLSNLTYEMSFTSLSYDNNTVLVNAVRIGFRTSTVDSHYFFFFGSVSAILSQEMKRDI